MGWRWVAGEVEVMVERKESEMNRVEMNTKRGWEEKEDRGRRYSGPGLEKALDIQRPRFSI